MKQLTLRGFDASLEQSLRRLADERQISLNRAALELMRRGAGLTERKESDTSVGAALDSFIGVWTTDEEEGFLAALEPLERIDPEIWS